MPELVRDDRFCEGSHANEAYECSDVRAGTHPHANGNNHSNLENMCFILLTIYFLFK